MSKLLRLLVALTTCLGACASGGEITITRSPDGRSVIAAGAEAGVDFSVRVVGADDLPAMAGEITAVGGGLKFTPKFPLEPGLRYRASVGEAKLEFVVAEVDNTPVARVSAVFPSAGSLPENLLKFYIHFSEPMAIGEASKHIRLLRSDGEQVALPFLELAEELWDPLGKRLTLFFDPGRVKRGLKPHEEEGRALEAGKIYELQIDAAWRDASGRPMVEGFSKRFRAGKADYEQPDARQWKIQPPGAGTRDALRLDFGEALDHGLLERILIVYNDQGKALDGSAAVAEGEKQWLWKPDEAWKSGSYRVVVEAILEDLAGNSVARLFEEIEGVKEAWDVRGGRFIRVPFVVGEG